MKRAERKRSDTIAHSTAPHVIAVIGTTASGKSDLALKLAKRFNGVIVAADARTIYKGLDIGTAKPLKSEQSQVPHFMLDVITPRQRYSAQKYQQAVWQIIKQQSRHPIFLVGGNGLYIDAVLKGLNFADAKPDRALRTKLNKMSLGSLQKLLKKKDPRAYRTVALKNKRRVVRALEIKQVTGKSSVSLRSRKAPGLNILKIGLTRPRAILKKGIDRRVTKMFRAGWVAEVKRLVKKYPKSAPGFSSHGYPEIVKMIQGQMSKAEAQAKITHNVWLYAKRQLNWFGRDPEIIWLSPGQLKKAQRIVRDFLASKTTP